MERSVRGAERSCFGELGSHIDVEGPPTSESGRPLNMPPEECSSGVTSLEESSVVRLAAVVRHARDV